MHEFGSPASAHGYQYLALLRGQQRSILVLCFKIVAAPFTAQAALFAGDAMLHVVLPNVRAKLAPAAWRAGQQAKNGPQAQRLMASVPRRWGSA